MFGRETKVNQIEFRYNQGMSIIKYMNNNKYTVDICLWDEFNSSKQITIKSKYAKNFFMNM